METEVEGQEDGGWEFGGVNPAHREKLGEEFIDFPGAALDEVAMSWATKAGRDVLA